MPATEFWDRKRDLIRAEESSCMIDLDKPLQVPQCQDRTNPIELADDLIAHLVKSAPAKLIAKLDKAGMGHTWRLVDNAGHSQELLVRESKSPAAAKSEFRAMLARVGFYYIGDESMYGGYAQRLLISDGHSAVCVLFLSNEGLSGYWLRGYSAPATT